MTYEEAKRKGVIDKVLDRGLTRTYEELKLANPKFYQTENSEFKNLNDVKEEAAKVRFARIIEKLQKEFPKVVSIDTLASYRFVPVLEETRNELTSGKLELDDVLTTVQEPKPLFEQFLLKKQQVTLLAAEPVKDCPITLKDALASPVGQWSSAQKSPEGKTYFFTRDPAESMTSTAGMQLIGQVRTARGDMVKLALGREDINAFKKTYQGLKPVEESGF